MKKLMHTLMIFLGLVICLALTFSTAVRAEKEIFLEDLVVITGEVVGIDYLDRIVILLMDDDEVVTLEVSEEARNFDQVELGDIVEIEYYESVDIYLGKHGETPGEVEGTIVARSPKGDKPAGMVIETTDVTAVVDRIDKNRRFLYLKGPDGRITKVHVKHSIKAFDTMGPGDSIHARYTEAFAISVTKP